MRPDHDVRLYPSEGVPGPGEPWGSQADPGDDIFELEGHHFHFSHEDVEDAIRNRDIAQIAIRIDTSAIELLAIMRHELQHVIQKRDDDAATLANGMLGAALEDTLGSDARRQIHGVLPAERNANEAAGRLARSLFASIPVYATLGPHAILFADLPDPPAMDELGAGALALAALIPRSFGRRYPHKLPSPETWSADRKALAMAEVVLGFGGRDRWARLANSQEMAVLRSHLTADVRHATNLLVPAAWDEVRATLLRTERLGMKRLST